MSSKTITFISMLIIALIATIIPFVIKNIKFISVPIVVGEIIAGIILGKSGFNLIEITRELDFLYEIGLAFLMFLSGIEIDMRCFRKDNPTKREKLRKKPLYIATISFLLCIFISFVVACILKKIDVIPNVIIFTLVFSSTAIGVVVPTLKERKLIDSKYGQTILLTAVISDFSTMILLSIYISIINKNSMFELLLMGLLLPLFYIVEKLCRMLIAIPLFTKLKGSTSQIGVRLSYAILLLFIVISHLLKTEIILGAFLAGLMVSSISEKEENSDFEKLDAIGYGIFVSFFFILIGANLHIQSLLKSRGLLLLLPLFIFIIYIVNFVSTGAFRHNFSMKMTFAASFILSSRLSLIIAAGAIAYKLNLIDSELNSIIILTAIVTSTISPIMFHKLSNSNFKKLNSTL